MAPRPFTAKGLPLHRRVGGGRPTTYKPEYCDQVIDYMGKGHSLTGFAGHIRMSRDTMYEWMAVHPEFSDAVHRGRAARVDKLEGNLIHATTGAQSVSMIFALKNACPEEYAEVRNLRVEHNVKLEKLTDEQLREIINRGNAQLPQALPLAKRVDK